MDCGNDQDDANHTIFVCDVRENRRNTVETFSGEDLSAGNTMTKMPESNEAWEERAKFITYAMKNKKEEERRCQNQM